VKRCHRVFHLNGQIYSCNHPINHLGAHEDSGSCKDAKWRVQWINRDEEKAARRAIRKMGGIEMEEVTILGEL
jgi:hypothetical protein